MENEDEVLKKYIDRLGEWSEDTPPTVDDMRRLDSDLPLTESERDRLELLARNHVIRARSATEGGKHDLAVAEMGRAVLLQPREPKMRVELADAYLQRALDRGYGRKDRQRAVGIAEAALRINPDLYEAERFLQEYRKMDAAFRGVARRRLWPLGILVLLLVALGLWFQRDFFVGIFSPTAAVESGTETESATQGVAADRREVSTDLAAFDGTGVEASVTSSSVGRNRDSSWVDLQGRLTSRDVAVSAVDLEIRGRGDDGQILFSIPWSLRGGEDPRLYPGDTEAFRVRRWLAAGDDAVARLELRPLAMETDDSAGEPGGREAPITWGTVRPEESRMALTIRNARLVEAYDRQVMFYDVSLENTGNREVEELRMVLHNGAGTTTMPWEPLDGTGPPMRRGESRVFDLAVPAELAATVNENTFSVQIEAIAVTE